MFPRHLMRFIFTYMQIVMLVTKAVSDQFGGGGISDRMIRFNGYPFLEKEDKEDGDHAFIEQSKLIK